MRKYCLLQVPAPIHRLLTLKAELRLQLQAEKKNFPLPTVMSWTSTVRSPLLMLLSDCATSFKLPRILPGGPCEPLHLPEPDLPPLWLGFASFYSPGPLGSLLDSLPSSQTLPWPPVQIPPCVGACRPLLATVPS